MRRAFLVAVAALLPGRVDSAAQTDPLGSSDAVSAFVCCTRPSCFICKKCEMNILPIHFKRIYVSTVSNPQILRRLSAKIRTHTTYAVLWGHRQVRMSYVVLGELL